MRPPTALIAEAAPKSSRFRRIACGGLGSPLHDGLRPPHGRYKLDPPLSFLSRWRNAGIRAGMADLLELLLNVLLEVAGAYWSWRAWVTAVATLAVVAGLCWLIPSSTAASVLAVPVVVGGLVFGFVWERGA